MSNVPTISGPHPKLGVVIRFSNSATTLPAVLDSLHRQTVKPELILGVNSGSTDASAAILGIAGARIVVWTQPYHHARVLNFALSHCPTDLVLVLSSHTVLRSPDAIEKLIAAMADPRTACASAKWDDDPHYSDEIDWPELQAKGLKFCSIYSNSMGMIRRSLWETTPFDETLVTMEDGAWALQQLKSGHLCRRVSFDFDYQRSGHARDYTFAVVSFRLAARHGLSVAWLGARATASKLLREAVRRLTGSPALALTEVASMKMRLKAWVFWRLARTSTE